MGKHNKVAKHLQKARELKAMKAMTKAGGVDEEADEDVVGIYVILGEDDDDIDLDEQCIDATQVALENEHESNFDGDDEHDDDEDDDSSKMMIMMMMD